MDKNTFGKLVRKPILWQKAKGVLLFAKHKMTNGKLPLVAAPFKQYPLASKCFKEEVKKDRGNYTAKLTLLASFEWKKGLDGNMSIVLTPMQGGMNLDYAQASAQELFKKMQVDVKVVGAAGKLELDDLTEINTASGEEASKKSEKKTQKELEKRNKRLAKIDKITEKLGKFEKSIGRVDLLLLEEKIVLFDTVLEEIKKEAKLDGKIDPTEAAEIDRLKANLDKVKKQLENNTANPQKSLTAKQREQMFAGLDKMEKYIDKVLKKNKLVV